MSAADEGQPGFGKSSETRKVRITRLDPWSVAKSSFMLGVTIAGVIIVATVALWLLLSAAGVFEAITGLFQSVSGDGNSVSVSFLSLGRLVGLSMVISAIEIVLLSVLSVIFAVLYNLSVGFTGGIEVSVADSGTK